jgi:thiol-disulfide isomerase/thioredoxin
VLDLAGTLVNKLAKYRVLLCGILSPLAALVLYVLIYGTLTRFSKDLEKDWLFRLSLATSGMILPFLLTLVLAWKDSRRHALFLSGKIGLVIACLSLALVWKPAEDGIQRWKQSRNQAMRNVAAPPFETLDLDGKTQRLADHRGDVVLVNIWATWCGPCRAEMPRLDRLYRSRKNQRFIVFGLSDEDVAKQRDFLKEIPVSYPLLTVRGNIPALYRDIARYPALFVIDRNGQLQPAPGPDQPFEALQSAVDQLVATGPS